MVAIDNLRVLADWNRTAQFTGGWDHPLSDITSRVRSLEWEFGFNAPGQLVAPPSAMTLKLDNADGAFNITRPGSTYGSLLKRDVLIKVLYDTTPLVCLKIADIAISPGNLGGRVVQLSLVDWHDDMMGAVYDPPLTLNTATGIAVSDACANTALPIPYAKAWWLLDASQLDIETTLYQTSVGVATGYTTLGYVGDNIDNGAGNTLRNFIEEMCAAEMDGRFFPAFNSRLNGVPGYIFVDRNWLTPGFSVAQTPAFPASLFTDAGAEYEYARRLCNKLEVTMYPRRVGVAGTELARTGSAFRLQPGETRTVTLRYRDPDYPDGTCTATTLIQPVASTDYTANTAQDGSGADVTGALGVSVTNKTSAADVLLVNSGAVDLYVTLFKIRGTPLTARQPVTVNAVNAQSIRDYGEAAEVRTVAGVDNQELVQAYADQYVKRYSTPQSRYRRVTFDVPENATSPLYGVAWGALGQTVRIVDDWVEDPAQARPAWIAGQRHVVDTTERRWQTTWYLEDALAETAWRFDNSAIGVGGELIIWDGLSILGQTTRLAF
jgi:hypothetical protein